MQSAAGARRRWWGTFVLTLSLVMLIWGETVLEGFLRQHPILFIVFWLACILLTGSALVIALLEMRAIRREWQGTQRELLRETMKDLEVDIREGSKSDRAR